MWTQDHHPFLNRLINLLNIVPNLTELIRSEDEKEMKIK